MRFLLGMCVVGLALSAALVGCGESEAPEKVEYFDREVDGELPPPLARMRRHILAGSGSDNGTEDGSEDSGSGDTAIGAVKGVVAKMKAAVAANKLLVLADHYNPAQAAIAKQYIKGVADEKAAMVEAQTVVIELDPALMGTLTPIAGTYEGPWDMLAGANLESLIYSETAGAIQVVDPGNPRQALVFTNVGGQWVYTYQPWAGSTAQALPALGQLAGARAEVLAAIAQGVRQATINAANFNENVEKLTQEKISPLLSGAPLPTPPAPAPPGPTGDAATVTVRVVNATGGELTVKLTGGTSVERKLAAGETATLKVQPGSYEVSLNYSDTAASIAFLGTTFAVDKSVQWSISASFPAPAGTSALKIAETDLQE